MKSGKLDRTDLEILNILQEQGDITNKELAQRIRLSPGSTHRRVMRLREADLIRWVRSGLNLRQLGYEQVAYVRVVLQAGKEPLAKFRKEMERERTLLELYRLRRPMPIGGEAFLLKVALKEEEKPEEWVESHLQKADVVASAEAWLVEETIKDSGYYDLTHYFRSGLRLE